MVQHYEQSDLSLPLLLNKRILLVPSEVLLGDQNILTRIKTKLHAST